MYLYSSSVNNTERVIFITVKYIHSLFQLFKHGLIKSCVCVINQ